MIIASLYPCPFDVQDRHDLNAAIICNGRLYAYEEDKLTGIKQENTTRFPERSLMMGCKEFGIVPSQVDTWVLPVPRDEPKMRDQFLFFAGIIKAYMGDEAGFPAWFQQHVRFVPHHISHASLAIFGSGFGDCAFVSQDGGGDFGDPRDMIIGTYSDGKIAVQQEHWGTRNICSFHAFVTDACNFSGGENGKTSGLAAYGEIQPPLYGQLRELLDVGIAGITFNRERYARTPVNLAKVKPQEYSRDKIFNQVPSQTNVFRFAAEYLPHDIAATGEAVMRDAFMGLLKDVRQLTGQSRCVFSGGLFQNVALNRAILNSGLFDDVYFPMAPSDSGLALGQALNVYKQLTGRNAADQDGENAGQPLPPYLGPSFADSEILALLERFRLRFEPVADPAKAAAELLAQGQVVGWFQGRAEHGQRSLGARSIIADPRSESSKARVNQRLKRRDWFMPYAPSILEEHVQDWAVRPVFSPYMQIALDVAPERRAAIPAAVHIDGTSRMHVVRRRDNPLYWQLIEHFRSLTGLPMVLNTSFNRHGIPTISSPRQAIEHLLEGCMDCLVIGPYVIQLKDVRVLHEQESALPREEDLLISDCVNRLAFLEREAEPAVFDSYLQRVKRLAGVMPVRRDGIWNLPGGA